MKGFFPEELYEARSLVRLSLSNQYRNDLNCTRSNGVVVNNLFVKGDAMNGDNYGFQVEILAKRGKLPHLKLIAIDKNNFSGTIASEIRNLKNLTTLNIDSNYLSVTIALSFTRLSNLRSCTLGLTICQDLCLKA